MQPSFSLHIVGPLIETIHVVAWNPLHLWLLAVCVQFSLVKVVCFSMGAHRKARNPTWVRNKRGGGVEGASQVAEVTRKQSR